MVGFWFLFSTEADLGLGRLLCLGRAPRHPAHQPVLDARQRHLRSAAGQAPVRLHRRRRHARRSDRIGPDRADRPEVGTNTLLLCSAGTLLLCAGDRRGDSRPGAGGGRRGHRHQGGARRHPGAGGGAAPRLAADPDHRHRHQLRLARRRTARSAGEHGGGGVQGRRTGRLDRRVPGADPLLHVSGRVRRSRSGSRRASTATWASASRC